ncbi:heterogeneous nuclear ribonucleoproteins A2/B1 isoform X1 [Gossypium hirsutum]|uniref:Heterogeneous nuclear ribonucleoproteins A2/B1-like isoform X1 n=1 Tax=Gossypium hirsutum TaxID=3635 RepID=A0A1U8KHA2_GOSHI|nr:heterogeneous nuclear ribonucleoproteins A2/B1 isoform X1 [Gossypium hirsutum]XP_016701836.1 heterogeneous nuclear ribonucleoproteins A2/B1 isoform X1 [Gossypium hirsutum]
MQAINGMIRVLHKNPLARSLWARNSCSKLFVGGLSYDTNETALKNAFEKYGEIIEAVRVIAHHVSGKSRGFGFVRFTSEASANVAFKEMHSKAMAGDSGSGLTDALCYISDLTINASAYATTELVQFWSNTDEPATILAFRHSNLHQLMLKTIT